MPEDDPDLTAIRERLTNPPSLMDRDLWEAAVIALAEQMLAPPPALARPRYEFSTTFLVLAAFASALLMTCAVLLRF